MGKRHDPLNGNRTPYANVLFSFFLEAVYVDFTIAKLQYEYSQYIMIQPFSPLLFFLPLLSFLHLFLISFLCVKLNFFLVFSSLFHEWSCHWNRCIHPYGHDYWWTKTPRIWLEYAYGEEHVMAYFLMLFDGCYYIFDIHAI